MSSSTIPERRIATGCVQVIPSRPPILKSASFVLHLGLGSRKEFSKLVSVSSNRGSVKFLWTLQDKAVHGHGNFSVQAISISGDMQGEPTDTDDWKHKGPEEGINNLDVLKESAKVKLEVNQEREEESVAKKDIWVEEYRLEESGQLSTVKVTVDGSSRSPTIIENVTSRLKPHLKLLIQTVQKFSIRQYIRDYGKKKPGPGDIKFNAAVYNSKEGVDSLIQWTSTELTLQHAQMARIAKDTKFLVFAFGLFGIVRILEAIVLTFTTRDPRKLLDASNAVDPLTVAFLANGMRKPMVAMLNVDPTDLQEVNRLKMNFWQELHAFYERQWKVMATLGIARLLNLIATHLPAAQFVTGKLKLVWDMMMTLPLF